MTTVIMVNGLAVAVCAIRDGMEVIVRTTTQTFLFAAAREKLCLIWGLLTASATTIPSKKATPCVTISAPQGMAPAMAKVRWIGLVQVIGLMCACARKGGIPCMMLNNSVRQTTSGAIMVRTSWMVVCVMKGIIPLEILLLVEGVLAVPQNLIFAVVKVGRWSMVGAATASVTTAPFNKVTPLTATSVPQRMTSATATGHWTGPAQLFGPVYVCVRKGGMLRGTITNVQKKEIGVLMDRVS